MSSLWWILLLLAVIAVLLRWAYRFDKREMERFRTENGRYPCEVHEVIEPYLAAPTKLPCTCPPRERKPEPTTLFGVPVIVDDGPGTYPAPCILVSGDGQVVQVIAGIERTPAEVEAALSLIRYTTTGDPELYADAERAVADFFENTK